MSQRLERQGNGESLQPSVALTEAQSIAVQGVLLALDTSSEKRVVFLEGLGGTGKKLVIDTIAPALASRNTTVNKYLWSSLDYTSSPDTVRALEQGHVVTMGEPREYELLDQTLTRGYPDNKLVAVPLQGMNPAEALAYVRAIKGDAPRVLTDEQLATYSMGIHEVAQMLIADPSLPEDIAVRVAGSHLGSDLERSERYYDKYPQAIKRFLRMEPGEAVIAIAQQQGGLRHGHLYDRLGHVLKNKYDLQQKGGDEESPLFVAPQSLAIYNKLFQSNVVYGGIQIFVPEVPVADFADLSRAFGLDAEEQARRLGYIGSGYSDGTRVKMFDESERKVDVWVRDPNGSTRLEDARERQYSDKAGQEYEQRFTRGELPLQARYGSEPVGSMYFRTYENYESTNALRGGW